ncbi:PaaI family thioesterase [Prosthecomicrobium sp. N25]|uniref:PaaI family thioesterase n=1 Tax=Prosthecomicrobium sp. N25 TaxID=3129254 RepID=UPI003076F99E
MAHDARNPDWIRTTLDTFNAAPFIRDLGCRLVDIEPGRIVTELELAERHLQQDGYVHAGVQATLADHTAGTAAATLMAPGQIVLTIEFKLSLLAPARGERLVCRADVLKPGRQVSFTEARVFAVADGAERLVSHFTGSMALVSR